MDHGWPLRPIHHHQLKKSSSAISAEKQIPIWVFGDLLDDHCVAHNVLNVFRFDVVPERRAEDLHGQYRTTKPALLASPEATCLATMRTSGGQRTGSPPSSPRSGVAPATVSGV